VSVTFAKLRIRFQPRKHSYHEDRTFLGPSELEILAISLHIVSGHAEFGSQARMKWFPWSRYGSRRPIGLSFFDHLCEFVGMRRRKRIRLRSGSLSSLKGAYRGRSASFVAERTPGGVMSGICLHGLLPQRRGQPRSKRGGYAPAGGRRRWRGSAHEGDRCYFHATNRRNVGHASRSVAVCVV